MGSSVYTFLQADIMQRVRFHAVSTGIRVAPGWTGRYGGKAGSRSCVTPKPGFSPVVS